MANRVPELASVLALALLSAIGVVGIPDTGGPGLTGRYESGDGGRSAETRGVLPNTRELKQATRAVENVSVRAEWRGYLHAGEAGSYRFAVRSTGDVTVFVDERAQVSTTAQASGVVDLTPGPHFVRVRYARTEGPHELAVLWGETGTRLGPITLEQTSMRTGATGRDIPFWRKVAVAVPIIWAALLLYVPVRIVGTFMWREVRRAEPDPATRRALAVVLILATGLAVWGIEWGITFDDWAPDELRPNLVRDALAVRYVGGWFDKYPALHYMALGLPLLAFETAERLPSLAADTLWSFTAQFVAVRLLSTLTGLGALLAAYLCAFELYGRRGALFAPLVLGLTPLYVFYAKLANLDIPQLCWFGWSLLGFIRLAKGGGTGAFVLMGVAASAAVATKDLAYASLALLAPASLVFLYRRHAGAWWRRLLSTFMDRSLWWGVLATAGATLVFQNIVLNPSGFRAHLQELLGYTDIGFVPRSVAGVWELTWRSVDLVRLSVGWPMFAFGAVGLLQAWRHQDRRWWFVLLLVPLSFHLAFTLVTYFVCDRYLFSGIFVFALFAGSALADTFAAGRSRVGVAAAALALVVTLPYAASINTMMNLDARKTARTYIVDRTTLDETVAYVGRYVPFMPPPLRTAAVNSRGELTATAPDFVLVNARFASRFESARRPDGRELLRGLRDGSLGYTRVFEYRATPPFWAWLQYESAFSGRGETWWTNLDKVNPEIEVYRRR